MPESNILPLPKEGNYDSVQGYTSNIECCLCSIDILVKTGTVHAHPSGFEVMWSLCHVCHDKGWQIPIVSGDYKNLVYLNVKTGEVIEHEILFTN